MRQLLTLTLLLITFSLYSQTDNYFGQWTYVSKSSNTVLNLDKEGFFYIEADGDKFGGKEFVQDGLLLESKYQIDNSTKPIKIDLLFIEKKSGNQVNHIRGIVEFISTDKMKICMDELGGERPLYFNPQITKTFKRIRN